MDGTVAPFASPDASRSAGHAYSRFCASSQANNSSTDHRRTLSLTARNGGPTSSPASRRAAQRFNVDGEIPNTAAACSVFRNRGNATWTAE